MGIAEAIAQGFRAIASYFGWATQRDAEKNQADIKQGAENVEAQKRKEAQEKHLKDNDVDEIRKDLSE